MEEQKRLFIAIILSIVIIVGWNTLFVDNSAVKVEQQESGQITPAGDAPAADKSAKVADYVPQTETGEAASTVLQSPAQDSPRRTITVSNPYYTLAVSEGTGAVTSYTLTQYRERVEKTSPSKQLISPKLTSGLFTVSLEGKSIPGLETAVFTAAASDDHLDATQGDRTLTLSWTSPHGIVIEKIFSFSASSYLIGLDVIIKNGSGVPFNDSIGITIPGIPDEENAQYAFEGPVAFINGKIQEIKPKDIAEQDTYQGTTDWAGFTDRYFISCIIPETPLDTFVKLTHEAPMVETRFIQQLNRIDPGKQIRLGFKCFMGPKSLSLLDSYGYNLKKAINFGWFDILAKPCLIGMNFIHGIIPNYGVAIMLLTLLIKLIFWPLGTKSYKSMNDMKKVQPLMMAIREKYKDDKQKMNQEVMGLYKTYKVNPMSGCLPMIVQMPIFFALYRMLYQAIELRHAPFLGWINDLSAPDRLFHFNMTIPFMQAPYGLPVLTIIMGVTMFLQQKMSPSTGDPTQAKMMMLMPIFMTVIFINFPAGLVLYWLVNNVLSIGQQYYIQKKFA